MEENIYTEENSTQKLSLLEKLNVHYYYIRKNVLIEMIRSNTMNSIFFSLRHLLTK